MSKNLFIVTQHPAVFCVPHQVNASRIRKIHSTFICIHPFSFLNRRCGQFEWVMLCSIRSLKRLQIKHLIRIEYHICFQLLSKTKVPQIEHYHCVSFFANSCLLGWSEITFSAFLKWVFLVPGFVFAPYYPPASCAWWICAQLLRRILQKKTTHNFP